LLLLILSILCCIFAQQSNPTGIRVILDERGVSSSISQSIPDVLKLVQVPNVSGSKQLPIIGNIAYWLSDFQFQQLSIGSIQVNFHNGSMRNETIITSNNIAINMSLKWKYEDQSFPYVSDSGTCQVTVNNGSSLNLGLQVVSIDSEGRPIFKANNVKANLRNLKVQISGGLTAEVADILSNLFSSQIQYLTESAIEDVITEAIDYALNENIKHLEMKQRFIFGNSFKFEVDCGINSIIVDPNGFLVASVRAISSPGGGEEIRYPFEPAPMPFKELISSRTGNVYINDFVINSLTYSLYQSGQLKILVTQEMVKDVSPLKLDTDSLGKVIPQISKAFPSNLPVQLDVEAATYPSINSSANSTVAKIAYTFNVKVINGTNIQTIFIMHLDLKAQLSNLIVSEINEGAQLNVSGLVSDIQFEMSATDSTIGEIDLSSLKILFNGIVVNGIAKKYIVDFQKGFILNHQTLLPGLFVSKPAIIPNDGFNAIGGTITWKTPSKLFKPPSRIEWEKRLKTRQATRRLAQQQLQ
jgi:hypothetical protein